MTAAPCDRYPCDSAYKMWSHKKQDGRVVHICSAGGSDGEGWQVATIAVGNGPWRVGISIGGEPYQIIEPDARQGIGRARETPEREQVAAMENAIHLSNAIAVAVVRMIGVG